MSPFWALVLYGLIQCSCASDLRGTSMSTDTKGDQVVFTLNYIALTEPEVLWRNQVNELESDSLQSNDFNLRTGEGVATLTVDQERAGSIGVSLYEPGNNVTISYSPQYFSEDGDNNFELPDVEVWSPLGDDWVYDAGVPFDVSVRFTKNNRNYHEPQLFWAFIGVDGGRIHPEIELAMAQDPNTDNYMTEPEYVTEDSYIEVTTTTTLTAKQGIVGVTISWTSDDHPMVSIEKLFTIREKTQSGVFPPGFIGVYQPLQFIGRSKKRCYPGESCSIHCVAVGYDIASLELVKTGENQKIPASTQSSNTVFSFALFDVSPQTDEDFTNYTCLATSSQGATADVNIGVMRETHGLPLP